MKRNYLVLCLLGMSLAVSTLCGCSNSEIEPIYRTQLKWKNRFKVEKYNENLELSSIPNGRPSAVCRNGIFVGTNVDGVDVYKGIPYAKEPVGQLRFRKAQPVDPSDKIYNALYFGKSVMQKESNEEPASLYEQGEDCLKLNIWNNTLSKNQNKPVLVYIHGGGFVNGGTSDPLYDGWNFAYYNPDVIVVTIAYRFGMMGYLNLSYFDGNSGFEYSANNGVYDQIEALKWINENIGSFGGDKNNITICGESAGGASVSILCVLDAAKGLFKNAIPMSGAVNLCVKNEDSEKLPYALKDSFNISTVKELQAIPYNELSSWWNDNYSLVFNNPVIDGYSIPGDLFNYYKNGASKDINILQGHTANEFRYYYNVFGKSLDVYKAACDVLVDIYKEKSNSNFDVLYDEYKTALLNLGYKEDEVEFCFADDVALSISNTYQALLHAQNNGSGYSYTFDIPYDITYDDFDIKAAHAIDCYYLFGNFDGVNVLGNDNEVETSIRFQKMIANFCKNGDPSTKDSKWDRYDTTNRNKMIFKLTSFKQVTNPEKERVDAILNLLKNCDSFYGVSMAYVLQRIIIKYPELANYISNL